MQISLIKNKEIINFQLPITIQGNYWITDIDLNNQERNLVNIEAKDDKWILNSNFETKIIINNSSYDNIPLTPYNYYYLKLENTEESMLLYCSPIYDETNKLYNIVNTKKITIGKKNGLSITYNNLNLLEEHATITFQEKIAIINNNDAKFGTFVNGKKITNKILEHGDVIFILGLKIIYCGNFLVINNPKGLVTINSSVLNAKFIKPLNPINIKEDDYVELYKEDDYFFRAPRFRTKVEEVCIKIDPPPEKSEQDDTPTIYTVGPMLTMGVIAIVTIMNNISLIISGEKDFVQILPNLITSIAMLCSMLLWPLLLKRYSNKKAKNKEAKRQHKYSRYIESKKNEIENIITVQKTILLENNVTLEQCQDIIFSRKRNLWEKDNNDDDFLKIRLGIGNILPEIKIEYPEEGFTMLEDNLKNNIKSVLNDTKFIENVPVSISLAEKNIVALIGEKNLTKQSLESMLLQLVTFHNYVNLKIIMLTNTTNEKDYEYMKVLPHCWNNDRSLRFFATNIDDARQISSFIEQILETRKYKKAETREENNDDYQSFDSYYIIITDDFKQYRNLGIIKEILNSKINYGFSIIIKNDKLSNLPNECSGFISIGSPDGRGSGFFENELISEKQKTFFADLNSNRIDMYACSKKLANIPIKIDNEEGELPKSLGFLEMYNVGNIEQLNVINRWKSNNPTINLQAPVGFGEQNQLFKLDIHEKVHGPHGLIAGMTGSGKSEFIITYILSLAINFHPYEVQFVLIDYKGGGLAGAFKNKITGIKLPHLTGTITNLDTVEMRRSLDSIQSELRRRQTIFNKAREKLNESTIDIYKYQRLYREGLVDEPMSHLLIISDEFAELKQQQPEFMEQLISTARIGRSLGVHLILATQKPSGVVDDQIWSNSKFRVCLKVQDKSDSNDMIKRPDAAALKEVGRFFLQVGYNEFFAIGQSAWTGTPYIPKEKPKRKIDTSMDFINNIGILIKEIEDTTKNLPEENKGEELSNIVKYLSDLANKENLKINQLWLDRIPENIYVEELKKKYNYQKQSNTIEPIIGEYDNPKNQQQGLLTLKLSENGNTIIFGSTGSGKSELLTTIIYSCITNYTEEEINFYILDFGSEILKMFEKAPQVGDVILSSDNEKVNNLFKKINNTIIERKKELINYNGNFELYNKKSDKKMPYIVIIINGFEVFSELYDNYLDELLSITRDCLKYGILFILTASSSSSIRYRTRQNFKELITLQLNDTNEYIDILGKINGVYPSDNIGRGLIKLDNVYEFQSALPCPKEQISEYIEQLNLSLSQTLKGKAEKIPILPKIINEEFFNNIDYDLSNVPIGIQKESLKVQTYDFKNNNTVIVSGLYSNAYEKFIKELINVLSKKVQQKLILLDASNCIKDYNDNILYYNSNYEQIINAIKQYSTTIINKKEQGLSIENENNLVCVIVGINKFIKSLSSNEMKEFSTTLENLETTKKITFILVDAISGFKEYEFQDWYKKSIINTQGIWLGSGINEQFTLKVSTNSKITRSELTNNLGFVIKNGHTTLVKFLENGDDTDE